MCKIKTEIMGLRHLKNHFMALKEIQNRNN